MSDLVYEQQDVICEALEAIDDDGAFQTDTWQHDDGGGGRSRILEEGDVFEKGGVNVSVVEGELSPEAARQMGGGEGVEDLSFWAAGLSLVIHPRTPMIPTFHANYRYFERGDGEAPGSWWFGGGSDLTPYYLFEEDAEHFHETLREVCDAHDPDYYPEFKAWCDDYFYLDHRDEARGVGGIFFDNLNDGTPDELFDFISDCAESIVPSYRPIVERRMDESYSERHRRWQTVRRGRYVEFNLLYDRGTKFGLRSGGRTESILMSMPPEVRWEYDHRPDSESPEAALLEVLREPRDWA